MKDDILPIIVIALIIVITISTCVNINIYQSIDRNTAAIHAVQQSIENQTSLFKAN